MHHKNSVGLARAVVLSATVALAAQWTGDAHAQWLPDRNYAQGPGIRVGDLELHPGLAVRGGYDTNVFRNDERRIGSAILAVTPHLNISTLSRQRATQGEDTAGAGTPSLPAIAFNAGLAGTLFYYFEKSAPSNVEFDTNALLSVLPDRRAGFDVGIDYGRSTRPFTAYTGDNANNKYALDRIKPTVNFRAQSRSGVLKGNIGYAPTVSIYENSAFDYLNAAQHDIVAGASWKFLPYTALLYDGKVGFLRYQDPIQSNAVVRLTSSTSTQSRIGLNGAITTLLSLRALVGYAAVLNEDRLFDDKEDVVAEAAARYGSDAASGELGYQRSLQTISLGGWMQMDRGYIKASFLFAQMFALSLDAGIAHANYGKLLAVGGGDLGFDKDTGARTSKREDIRVDAGAHAEYRATNWLALSADFTALTTLTDFQFDRAGSVPYPAQFKSYQAFGGVRVHY